MSTVLVGVMLTAAFVAICVALVWPWDGGLDFDARVGKASPAAKRVRNRHPESLEGVLAWQLALGQITSSQYRRAMSDLAERDAAQHPLEVPRD